MKNDEKDSGGDGDGGAESCQSQCEINEKNRSKEISFSGGFFRFSLQSLLLQLGLFLLAFLVEGETVLAHPVALL